MYRLQGDMARACTLLLLGLAALSEAGPLGPLPNVTSIDFGFKEGGCTVGDVVYAAGEQFPGATPCERCACAGGAVSCAQQACQPRPGCKALHRPDHCCPTYQCECELEGRVYGNGEKLVDPQDPCRVCYCQGGEVVCRRIACFVRDDCTPRRVPGRCCPEYDNCPLRGVTTVPGVTPLISTSEEATTSFAPTPPRENIKQEITIKEITPVSEIPVQDVRVQEVLPSAGIDVPDYASSKSPLIVREATSENPSNSIDSFKPETPVIIEVTPEAAPVPTTNAVKDYASPTEVKQESKNNLRPSKISLANQDSINSDIYPSIETKIPTMGSPYNTPIFSLVSLMTKAPMIEEEDPTFFDHNPAFPPLPDDLSVLGIHEDETVLEQTGENEHTDHEQHALTQEYHTTAAATTREILDTTVQPIVNIQETSTHFSTNSAEISTAGSSVSDEVKLQTTAGTEGTSLKNSPMLNLRSAIPTEILNVPSSVPEDINGEMDRDDTTSNAVPDSTPSLINVGTESVSKEEKQPYVEPELFETKKIPASTTPASTPTSTTTPAPTTTTTTQAPTTTPAQTFTTTTQAPTTTTTTTPAPTTTAATTPVPTTTTTTTTTTEAPTTTDRESDITQVPQKPTTSNEAKSNIVTEITAETEFSSLPIETSDQNPRNSENNEKEKTIPSTLSPTPVEAVTTRITPSIDAEIITVSRSIPSFTDNNQSFENIETTEFILTPFGSSESATDAVELIKISAEPEKKAAIIDSPGKNKNSVLTDLIDLVGDVASIGDHTDGPEPPRRAAAPAVVSESEELIPVNAGYKSKNNNWNLNSITEVPVKSKSSAAGSKQKVMEIDDEEADGLTDAPPPYDRVEPTTRRPLIDNVSDSGPPGNGTDKKDIEIITKSYVPTINRRPTKVVMKKSNDRPAAQSSAEVATSTASTPSDAPSTTEPASSTTETASSTPEAAPSVTEVAHSSEAAPSTNEVAHGTPEIAQSTTEIAHSMPEVSHSTPEVVYSTPEVAHSTPEVANSTPEPATTQTAPTTESIPVSTVVALP